VDEINLAKEELVDLRQSDGSDFVLFRMDEDLAAEVELLKSDPEFMTFLKRLL